MSQPHPVVAHARPKLGELLVERGVLTEEQLGNALDEQQASGLPLGAILVRDGLVASHTVAILLAEQSGGPLKTEFGFAVGAVPAKALVAEPAAFPSPAWSEAAPTEAAPLRVLEAETVERPPGRDPALELLEAQLEAEVAARRALEAKLADVEAGTETALAGQSALERRLAELEARTQDALAGRAALEEKLAELEADAEVDRVARHGLEQDIELHAQELAAIRPPARLAVRRPYTSARHILLAPVGDRYELVERAGPPPEPGSPIELFGDRSFVVVRVGPAPLPGALEACAYLEPIPTRFPPTDADTEPS